MRSSGAAHGRPPRPRWRLWLALLVGASAVALTVVPSQPVEQVYAARAYPIIQSTLTGWSNLLPVSAFDVIVVGAVGWLIGAWTRAIRRARRERQGSAIWRMGWWTAMAGGVAYLWFLAAWGLNYARPPVEDRLQLPAWHGDPASVAELLDRAVAGANTDHGAAHAEGFPGASDVPASLAFALHGVERAHGRLRPTTPSRPKPTLLALYFRMAGVDGLTAPFALETLLNPDLTGPERPFTLAHEWAHLAGYAPEADANFVAWLTTQRAGGAARYSSWLFLMGEASRQVSGDVRRAALARLDDGPRRDLAEIAQRAARQVDMVQRLGWRVYDGYLRSQGVREGLVSYSRVVELIVRAEQAAAPAR